jgi:uncharacterized membrane protein YbhN (UPF0104 family)
MPFHISPLKAVGALALALALGVGVFTLLTRLTSVDEMRDAVQKAGWGWIAVAFLGFLISYFGYIISYRDTARAFGGPTVSYWQVARVVMAGFGAFTVGTTAGGLAVDFWAMHRAGLRAHDAAKRVLALNTLQWASLTLATAFASALVLAGVGTALPIWLPMLWVSVVGFCFVAAAWVSGPSRRNRFTQTEGVPKWRAGIGDAIGGVVLVRLLLLQPRKHFQALIGYPVYWFGDALALYAGLSAFGPNPNVADMLIAYTTGYIAVALPLPAGGAGGIDAAMVGALALAGIPIEQALLGVLVYRLFTFWLPIVPALSVIPLLPGLGRELDQVKAAHQTVGVLRGRR